MTDTSDFRVWIRLWAPEGTTLGSTSDLDAAVLDGIAAPVAWGQYYSIAWLGLARASVLSGDVAKARKAFETFFDAWKDADPDIAILQQAKAEYSKLP